VNSLKDPLSTPKEMAFASGSGLDPHISPEAAFMQVERISLVRHFDNSQKEKLLKKINELTVDPQFLFLGEQRINVLVLNLDLDKI
jgi:K+-transporting ATPase ATPase C chain